MTTPRLGIGDQISLINEYLTYAAGTSGTITYIYRFNAAAYRVRFEGQAIDEIAYHNTFTAFPCKPAALYTAPLGG